MPSLYVQVRDGQGQPVNHMAAYWSLPEQSETAGRYEQAHSRIRLDNVPASDEFTVRITRRGAPDLWVALDLDERGDRRFPRGKPTIMQLSRQRVRGRLLDPTLDVVWHQPQEVILCAGRDTHHGRASVFPGIAVRRFASMARPQPRPPRQGVIQVYRSCVLTLFELNMDNSRVHYMLAGRSVVDLAGRRFRAPVVAMKSFTPGQWRQSQLGRASSGGRLSVTDVYDYLELIGRHAHRRGTVHALEFFSHAYWIGPVLNNTSRRRRIDFCRDRCPVDREHRGTVMQMPPQMRLPRFLRTQIGCWERARVVSHMPLRNSHNHSQRDTQRDTDPRNTDFTPGIMSDQRKQNIRAALHSNAILRVWGCNNGDLGPRWRAAVSQMRGRNNRHLTIRSNKAGSHPYRQLWKIRRGDLKLYYYSIAHRGYPQAIATALQRPCYAAAPGTWSWYRSSRRLQGMTVNQGTLSRMRSFLASLPNFNERDEAGYYRWDANITRYDVEIKVLITGFVPFRTTRSGRFSHINSAQLVVENMPSIFSNVSRPPWINLSLTVRMETTVDVVWTCRSPTTPVQGAPSRPPRANATIRGSGGILQIARDYDADIVVMLGGSSTVRRARRDMRVEQFARNYGSSHMDNDGNRLVQAGEIFPGKPSLLESTIPRPTWTYVVQNLNRAGFRVHIPVGSRSLPNGQTFTLLNSAGDYICNESFYTLLLEAREGNGRRSPPSGRWVTFVHVAAIDDNASTAQRTQQAQRLARGLGVMVTTLVEEMLWAREPYGRVLPNSPDQIHCIN